MSPYGAVLWGILCPLVPLLVQPKPMDSRARLATFGTAKPLSAGAHGGACVKGVAVLSYRGVGYQILEMRWSSLQPWPCCSLKAGCLRVFLCFHQGTALGEQVAEAEDVFMIPGTGSL